jgi:hypothetical protein
VLANDGEPCATTYAWQVRTYDGTDFSDWSQTCSFTTDGSSPASPPGVSSSNYPRNGGMPGVPAEFTFTANGVGDIAGYEFSWHEITGLGGYDNGPFGVPIWPDPFQRADVVRACSLGGSATVSLSPPNLGQNRLSVVSFDRAVRRSATTTYDINVPDTSPVVTADEPIILGQPFTVHVAPGPNVTGVLNYTLRVNSDPVRTVPAGPDGTISVQITAPSQPGTVSLQAHSTSANGWVSPDVNGFRFIDNSPAVSSPDFPEFDYGGQVGVAGTFRFAPRMANVVSYVYTFDGGPQQTVAAGPEGTASITYMPSSPDLHELDVYAVTANGAISNDYFYDFFVNPAS